MQNKHRFLFFSLAGILAAFLLSAASIPASGDGNPGLRFYESRQDNLLSGSEQTSPCMAILMEAAKQAGVQGTPRNVGGTGNQDCSIDWVVSGTGDPPPDATSTLFFLTETSPTPEKSCKFEPQEQFQSTTFHGYNAQTNYRRGETRMVNDVPYTFEGKSIEWCMHKGGRNHYIGVYTTTQSIEKYGPARDPLPIAEVLWSIAEDRLPLSEAPVDGAEQPALPVDPGGVVPGQPEGPTDETVPTEPGGLFGIPPAVILASLGIPVLGAVAGAVLSSLLSLLGTSPIPGNTNSVVVPEPDTGNIQGLYWSERPWDVAGPGYVSKEEYEQTKNMLEQGYKWTNGGWQTPDQIQESNQLQQNNKAAVALEDAEWQIKMEGERQALEQNAAELKKTAEELQAPSNMIDMKNDFEAINQELLDQNIYVVNPLQGDPTLIVDGLSKVVNIGWDITTGWVTPSNGLTCGDYVGETLGKVKHIVSEKYGPGAQVQGVIFEEKSTRNPQGVLDWFDKLNDDNHNLIKVTLPDGSEWAVDFHQHNTGNKPPILRPWNEAKKVWQDYLGDEFMERISVP